MKHSISIIGLATLAAMFLAPPAAVANEVTSAEVHMVTTWAQSIDKNQDHQLSKAEVLALVERAFASADTKKAGKLDMKQTAIMLREFDPRAVGVRPTLPRP